jgi:hypothetical protein
VTIKNLKRHYQLGSSLREVYEFIYIYICSSGLEKHKYIYVRREELFCMGWAETEIVYFGAGTNKRYIQQD